MIIPLKLARHDFCSHQLLRSASPVGWIGPRIIRLWGFMDREDAVRAASIATSTLSAWSAARKQGLEPHPSVTPDDHVIEVRGQVVGRVVSPALFSDGQSVDSYAIEVAVPQTTWLATKLELAQHLYGALLAEGVLEDSSMLAPPR